MGSWVVEPNVLGGWDVRHEDSDARRSRHASRDDAVEAARGFADEVGGGDVVVIGLRGEVLSRLPASHHVEPSPEVPATPSPIPPGMRLSEMLTLTDQTDETGRLLLEDSAPKGARKRAERVGIAMKTVSCPYKDTPSRYGGRMNASAYEALRHDTAEMLDGFAWLTGRYLELDPSNSSTVRVLYDTSYSGTSLALIVFHRADAPIPPHGSLPSYVASIFKASRGLFSAAVDMLNKTDSPSKTVTVGEVVQFAEQEGHLARPQTRRVCAAPTRLIERTISVILTGEGADASRSGLGELVDFATLRTFCALQDWFGQALSSYRVLLERVTQTGDITRPEELFSRVIVEGGRRRSFGDVTEELLRRANELQSRLNRLLGRADDAAPVALEDALGML